ncbi:MAG: membrane dipeptidase [Clostridia bacterium]|nr:membrane dipeptidase [Clostridia bacterium]
MDFFDLHSDTPYECYTKSEEFYVNQLAVSGEASKCFENWVQTFAIWIKDDVKNPFELYKKIYNDFKEKTRNLPLNLKPVLAVEGGAVLENDLDRLEILKEDKIKFLTLTWNGENEIAGGVDTAKGLTDFGKNVIDKMNRLKIGADLSHLNEKSFFAAVEKAEFPICTHSSSREIINHKRNLTDVQAKLIAEKGGVIGICLYPEFTGEDIYDGVYKNICYFCELGLEDNIAIGSDFDGCEMDKKLCKTTQIPLLYKFLFEKGLAKEIIHKVFYKNALNYIAKLD